MLKTIFAQEIAKAAHEQWTAASSQWLYCGQLRTERPLCHCQHEDNRASARPACGRDRYWNDNGYEKKRHVFKIQQEPEDTGEVSREVRFPICRQERDCCVQAGTAQSDGRLSDRDQVAVHARKVPLRRKVA